MFLAGAKNLDAKKEWINELNVFPVPDGDTGTNMSMTILSAAGEVRALDKIDMPSLAKAISSGSLRGARGNSGVILSQLFRGFTKGISKYEEIDAIILCDALQKAVETAYKAVMKPREGTILTVAKGAADKALELLGETEDLNIFIAEIIKHADYVLTQTPEMLPVLKQAGVVDSGGQGLMEILHGAYEAFLGKEIDLSFTAKSESPITKTTTAVAAEIKFGYCTEFIIELKQAMVEKEEFNFKGYLESLGDSIVVVADEEIVKVHVHTNDPGYVLQRALMYGQLSKIKIDNMREEHQEKLIKDAVKIAKMQKENDNKRKKKQEEESLVEITEKEMGFICVSSGIGLNEIFTGLGADYIIEGGQTMNPSTEDMLNAIEEVHAKSIFILPNNKNIILAANQAKSLTEHKQIMVIPTKTIPQGITALVNFIPEKSANDNEKRMIEEIGNVKTAQITYAIRDTIIDGKEIKQGDYMGIGDNGILSAGTDIEAVVKETVSQIVDEDSSIISIYYGQEITQTDAQTLFSHFEKQYQEYELELHSGGQPIYYYVISVE
jgi:DAK2 domain fusion protein YloV